MALLRVDDYLASNPPMNGLFHTIAIDGRGGSGKSSLSRYLAERYPELVVLHGDDYNQQQGTAWFGVANDALLLHDVFEPLRRGNVFAPRHYDWKAGAFTEPSAVTVSGMFCAEACFAFAYPLDWDLRLWVEVTKEAAFDRAVGRETAENGWDTPSPKYLNEWRQWQSREDEYIARSRPLDWATLVLDGTRPWTDQLE